MLKMRILCLHVLACEENVTALYCTHEDLSIRFLFEGNY